MGFPPLSIVFTFEYSFLLQACIEALAPSLYTYPIL